MKLLALLAFVPVALGPLPQEGRTLTVSLCLGGEIEIPLDGGKEEDGRGCHPLACHAGNCRERFDRDQGSRRRRPA